MSELKNNKTFKLISLAICFCFLFEQTGFAQTALELNLAAAFSNRLSNTFSQPQDKFRPLHLRYLDYDALSNNFKLLLDRGDSKNLRTEELQNTTKLLMEYFYIGLRLPNSSFWVNLRPDSADKTIDPYLAQTDLGKVLLEADVQLKKDTASYTSSQTPTGKEYWNKLYQKAEQLFGNQEVTIPTLTRPWIVPAEIILRESQSDAYIYKATLKVMLEEDYLKDSATYNFKDPRLKALNQYSSQLIRELIIPKLNKEVNSSKKYSNLRQAYYSLILAQWFKSRFKGGSLQGTIPTLIDSYDLTSLTSKTPWSKDTYFKQYQKSFKDGEYNIKEQVSTPYGQAIRSYVSGGIICDTGAIQNALQAGKKIAGPPLNVTAEARKSSGWFKSKFLLPLIFTVGISTATLSAQEIKPQERINSLEVPELVVGDNSKVSELAKNRDVEGLLQVVTSDSTNKLVAQQAFQAIQYMAVVGNCDNLEEYLRVINAIRQICAGSKTASWITPETVAILESILKTDDLQATSDSVSAETIYFSSVAALREIFYRRSELINPASLARMVIDLPDNLYYRPWPHYEVYTSPTFQFKIKQYQTSLADRYSIALSVYRLLTQVVGRGPELKETDIAKALDFIMAERSKFQERVIIGKGITVININGEDFNMAPMLVREQITGADSIKSFKAGRDSIEDILEAIANSKGPLTIYFGMHGTRRGVYPLLYYDKDNTLGPNDIYLALSKRGNLKEVNLLFEPCLSYKFAQIVMDGLVWWRPESESLPVALTSSSINSVAYEDIFGSPIIEGALRGMPMIQFSNQLYPITGSDLLNIESKMSDGDRRIFNINDPAILVPITRESLKHLEEIFNVQLNDDDPANFEIGELWQKILENPPKAPLSPQIPISAGLNFLFLFGGTAKRKDKGESFLIPLKNKGGSLSTTNLSLAVGSKEQVITELQRLAYQITKGFQEENFRENMGLIIGIKKGSHYQITRLIPITEFEESTTPDFLIPSRTQIIGVIKNELQREEKILGEYHNHSVERLRSYQRPGPSAADVIGQDLNIPRYESRIVDDRLGLVLEPEVDSSMTMDQIANFDPAQGKVVLYAYITPNKGLTAKIIDAGHIYLDSLLKKDESIEATSLPEAKVALKPRENSLHFIFDYHRTRALSPERFNEGIKSADIILIEEPGHFDRIYNAVSQGLFTPKDALVQLKQEGLIFVSDEAILVLLNAIYKSGKIILGESITDHSIEEKFTRISENLNPQFTQALVTGDLKGAIAIYRQIVSGLGEIIVYNDKTLLKQIAQVKLVRPNVSILVVRGRSHTAPYILLKKGVSEADISREFLGEEGMFAYSLDDALKRKIAFQDLGLMPIRELTDLEFLQAMVSVILINSLTEEQKANINFGALNTIAKKINSLDQLTALSEEMQRNPPTNRDKFGKNVHRWLLGAGLATRDELSGALGIPLEYFPEVPKGQLPIKKESGFLKNQDSPELLINEILDLARVIQLAHRMSRGFSEEEAKFVIEAGKRLKQLLIEAEKLGSDPWITPTSEKSFEEGDVVFDKQTGKLLVYRGYSIHKAVTFPMEGESKEEYLSRTKDLQEDIALQFAGVGDTTYSGRNTKYTDIHRYKILRFIEDVEHEIVDDTSGAIGKGPAFEKRNSVETTPLTSAQLELLRKKLEQLKAKVSKVMFNVQAQADIDRVIERLKTLLESNKIRVFKGIVNGKEDYLLAFANHNQINLMADMFSFPFAGYLDEILFHEGWTATFGEGSYQAHRKIIYDLQYQIFSEDNPLGRELRSYINSRASSITDRGRQYVTISAEELKDKYLKDIPAQQNGALLSDEYSILNGLSGFNSRGLTERGKEMLKVILQANPDFVRVVDLGFGSGFALGNIWEAVQEYRAKGVFKGSAELDGEGLSPIASRFCLKKGYRQVKAIIKEALRNNPQEELVGLEEFINESLTFLPKWQPFSGLIGKQFKDLNTEEIISVLNLKLTAPKIALILLLQLQSKGYDIFEIHDQPFISHQYIDTFLGPGKAFNPGKEYDFIWENYGSIYYSSTNDPVGSMKKALSLLSKKGVLFIEYFPQRYFNSLSSGAWSEGFIGIRIGASLLAIRKDSNHYQNLKGLLDKAKNPLKDIYGLDNFAVLLEALGKGQNDNLWQEKLSNIFLQVGVIETLGSSRISPKERKKWVDDFKLAILALPVEYQNKIISLCELDNSAIERIRAIVQQRLGGTYQSSIDISQEVEEALKEEGIDIDGLRKGIISNWLSNLDPDFNLKLSKLNLLIDYFMLQCFPDDVPVYRSVNREFAGLPGDNSGNRSDWVCGENGFSGAKIYFGSDKVPDRNRVIIKSDIGHLRDKGTILYDKISNLMNTISLVHFNSTERVDFQVVYGAESTDTGEQRSVKLILESLGIPQGVAISLSGLGELNARAFSQAMEEKLLSWQDNYLVLAGLSSFFESVDTHSSIVEERIFEHIKNQAGVLSDREDYYVAFKEALRNAIIWGNRGRADELVILKWGYENGKLWIDIMDEGFPWFDPAESIAAPPNIHPIYFSGKTAFSKPLGTSLSPEEDQGLIEQYVSADSIKVLSGGQKLFGRPILKEAEVGLAQGKSIRLEFPVSPSQRLRERESSGGIDPSTGSGSIPAGVNPGGIDFHALPIVTESIIHLKATMTNMPLGSFRNFNLSQEIADIERMLNSGITPSSERIKEYIQASCVKGAKAEDLEKVLLCIASILRKEEEECCSTDPILKDILVVLESTSTPQQLKEIFLPS